MACPNSLYYTPTSKLSPTNPQWKKLNLYQLSLIAFLCSLFYLLGAWQHRAVTITPTATIPATSLDFTSHHTVDAAAAAAATYPPCAADFSEYTPCEDINRSLKFDRERLIYRERHCPDKKELLKCRVPAPYGYKTPFKWPASRDLVWYANVPHKELTVEKAVQNWIRYEGDRFRFPGGGTMFPNGADSYIDDIGKLINLRDGSIRTAMDTGCGVKFLFSIFN